MISSSCRGSSSSTNKQYLRRGTWLIVDCVCGIDSADRARIDRPRTGFLRGKTPDVEEVPANKRRFYLNSSILFLFYSVDSGNFTYNPSLATFLNSSSLTDYFLLQSTTKPLSPEEGFLAFKH